VESAHCLVECRSRFCEHRDVKKRWLASSNLVVAHSTHVMPQGQFLFCKFAFVRSVSLLSIHRKHLTLLGIDSSHIILGCRFWTPLSVMKR
jgi:hypothetical protein